VPFGPWPGAGGGGGGGGGPLDYMEIHGDELMIINNADWPVNTNAPTESDSLNAAWKISRYDDPSGGASGRGYRRRVFDTATTYKLGVELRGDGVAAAANATFDLYWRVIDPAVPAAVPAWQFINVPAFPVRADAFHVEYENTITIGAGGGEIDLDEGLNEFELVRNGEGDLYAAPVDVGVVAGQQDPAP